MENNVLIVDNFQLIKGKERTQEEFWQLINKMIVIASREAPDDILNIGEKSFWIKCNGF